MPFQKGNNFGSHGNHLRGFACRNKEELQDLKWIRKDGAHKRIPSAELPGYLAKGWIAGRTPLSEETRKKQSESGKRSNNPAKWKPGHKTWNNGDKMPERACVAMSVGKLSRYGVTEAQVIEARASNLSWCSHHLRFEPNASFTVLHNGRRATRCNQCHNKHTPFYKERFSGQRGLCAICEEVEPRLDALSLDHKHNCPNPKHTRKAEPMIGCVCCRGLLCSLCNMRLGYFEGFLKTAVNPQFAEGSWEQKALAYLASYEELDTSSKIIAESL